MTVLHGDDRFCNNIFVQKWPSGGLHHTWHDSDDGFDRENRAVQVPGSLTSIPTYEEWIAQFELDKPANMGKVEPYHFGHLPVWSEGNVYLGGARAWKKEAHCLELSEEEPVRVELKEEDGKIFLDTNIYELIKDFKGRMIHTGILGKAFEPEQPL